MCARLLRVMLCSFCLLVSGLVGCQPAGKASVSGTLQVADCDALQNGGTWTNAITRSTMELLGTSTEAVTAELRLQTLTGTLTQRDIPPQDMIILSIRNPRQIQLQQAIPIVAYVPSLQAEPQGSDPSQPEARALLTLGQSCPALSHPTSFAIKGTVTFTSFGTTRGSAIEGSLTLDVSPIRPSSAAASGSLQASFQLTYNAPESLGKRTLEPKN